MSEDSSSKEGVDLAAIEARLANATFRTDLLIYTDSTFIRNAPTDIAALLARAKQQDARIAELEADVKGFKKDDRKTMKAVNRARKQNRYLIAEVKRLRGIGLKEFSWSEGGYGGGFECTIVAESLEKAREYIKKFFLNEPKTQGNYDGEFMLTNDPWDICDYTPKLSGYYEYHMDAGG